MLSSALNILKKINNEGFEAYIVGGFVRDYLLGITSSDIDIATNMPLNELGSLFCIDLLNVKHNSFVLNYNNFSFEVTNFRKELSYKKQRHPEIELVKSYKDDYIRRDFTVNALAFDFNMDLIDYCGGKIDLDNKIIKTIREPNLTFCEDPVRILRGIYFKNKYNLNFDHDTYNSITNNSSEVESISYNRLFKELSKLCFNFNIFIEDLINTSIYKYIHLTEAIIYIKNNKLVISNLLDIIIIQYYLTNKMSNWEIPSNVKKRIAKYIDIINNGFKLYDLFYCNSEIIEDINYFANLISLDFDINDKISQLVVSNINDINFSFSELNLLVDKNKIKDTKELIINKILNKELSNNYTDIIKFINTL